jgi:hypothetical protein
MKPDRVALMPAAAVTWQRWRRTVPASSWPATAIKVMRALGVRLSVAPAEP